MQFSEGAPHRPPGSRPCPWQPDRRSISSSRSRPRGKSLLAAARVRQLPGPACSSRLMPGCTIPITDPSDSARGAMLCSPRALAQRRLRKRQGRAVLAGHGASHHLQQSYARCDRHHMLSAWHRVDFLVPLALQQGAPSGTAPRLSRRWADEHGEGHAPDAIA